MQDEFGNYVIRKLFEHGNQVQKKELINKMKGKVVDLSMQVYACRVVQKVGVSPAPFSGTDRGADLRGKKGSGVHAR